MTIYWVYTIFNHNISYLYLAIYKHNTDCIYRDSDFRLPMYGFQHHIIVIFMETPTVEYDRIIVPIRKTEILIYTLLTYTENHSFYLCSRITVYPNFTCIFFVIRWIFTTQFFSSCLDAYLRCAYHFFLFYSLNIFVEVIMMSRMVLLTFRMSFSINLYGDMKVIIIEVI